MPIKGIGTDLVEKARIARIVEEYPERFADRVLTDNERQRLPLQDLVNFLSKRFAAKEAVAKAFGTGIGKEMAFNEIEVDHLPSGQPTVVLLGKAKAYAEKNKIKTIHLSLSDEKHYALAFVVIEY